MDKEEKELQIKEYREKIYKAKKEIKECEDKIDELNGLTETCPHCEGEGRIMTVHRMVPPHGYITCRICKGKGKITKEELEEINQSHNE